MFVNNSPDTLDVTLIDQDGVTSLSTWSAQANGAKFSLGSYYRNALISVTNGTVSATQAVYLSDSTIVTVSGTAAAGYRVDERRLEEYESMFWIGFGLYVGLWMATLYMKIVRAGVNQQVG